MGNGVDLPFMVILVDFLRLIRKHPFAGNSCWLMFPRNVPDAKGYLYALEPPAVGLCLPEMCLVKGYLYVLEPPLAAGGLYPECA